MARILSRAVGRVATDQQLIILAKLALLIGMGLLAVTIVALAQIPAAHEAFHDIRHAAGFPCH